jgi:hypothetical protein
LCSDAKQKTINLNIILSKEICMKQNFYVLFIMVGLGIFTGSATFAMDAMPPNGCCSMDTMGTGDPGMSCDHAACSCNHMESAGCQPGCACCAMCAEGGCNMINATIDLTPGNMNIKGNGLYFTAYIEIEENANQYTIDQIDKTSICLKKANDTMIMINGEMLYTVGSVGYGDYDVDGIPDLMVKFNRQALSKFLLANGFKPGDVSLTIGGNFYDGTKFEGAKTITISIKK